MQILVNDEATQVQANNITALLAELGYEAVKVAVAVNTEFVPRSQYASFALTEGDHVDVLTAVQGG